MCFNCVCFITHYVCFKFLNMFYFEGLNIFTIIIILKVLKKLNHVRKSKPIAFSKCFLRFKKTGQFSEFDSVMTDVTRAKKKIQCCGNDSSIKARFQTLLPAHAVQGRSHQQNVARRSG